MTKEEYNLELAAMRKRHIEEISAMYLNYALANSKVELANIIESEGIRIQVDSIGYYMSVFNQYPICRYSGFMITKEGKARKDLRRETIYQNDSIKIL